MIRLLEPAANAEAWGLSCERLLSEDDPFALMIEHRRISRSLEIRVGIVEAVAARIGNELARALGG